MRKILVVATALLITHTARAQFIDTLRACISRSVAPAFFFDSRNSFISDRRASIWGVKAGVEFGGKLTFGGGYNQHTNNLTKTLLINNAPVEAELRLAYVSYFARYVYYQSSRWKFSVMPVQIGFGRSRYRYELGESTINISRRGVIIYETGISVSYKILPWLGAGGDLGFRLMLLNNKDIPENFNSPIYSFYAIIYWGELYKMAFPDSKLAKKL